MTVELIGTSRREILASLDDAIEAHDGGAPATDLEDVLRRTADAIAGFDRDFSRRIEHLAVRAGRAAGVYERDAASMLAREVRIELMCRLTTRTPGQTTRAGWRLQ